MARDDTAMNSEVLSPALLRSMTRHLSVTDLIRMAETLKESGQEQAHEALYATWLEQNPEDPLLCAVLFNYSVLLTQSGKLEAARACLERAVARSPDFIPAYINLGRVYEQLGKLPLAVTQWSAAIARLGAIHGQAIVHKATALN
jgi:predicted O-linked N-acetylglucosamine transferase (SPINDLY family)